ncbi:hypothetical protein ATO10_02960 [Actibacterium atlanticum]|uniref:Right handed beta helix domain-containing protein n=1 Tax=Actibacterium atlanticum TaxID=1461693 RepID=A0A058ZS89_9RHOB|nr:hypothetical protein [Actibacterium atlanticum]KCV83686.1 hypothetical protein ATO10_02960 [Actibacterium atlanticum]
MIGDKGRESSAFGIRKRYDGVTFYAGRAIVAADLNEADDLQTDARERALVDVIGRIGFPKKAPGFRVTYSGDVVTLGAGRMYVHGARYELDAPLNLSVSDLLKDGTGQGPHILLAHCQKSELDYLDDPSLRDPALGGPDTAGRRRNVVEFSLVPKSEVADLFGVPEQFIPGFLRDGHFVPCPKSTPRDALAAFDIADDHLAEADDCHIAESGGYSRHGNFNYIVEIHQGGDAGESTFKWARDDVRAYLQEEDGAFYLLEEPTDDQRKFHPNCTIEIKGKLERQFNRAGVLGQLSYNPDGSVSLTPEAAAAFGTMQAPITLTRWDFDYSNGTSNGLDTDTSDTALENGLVVRFEGVLAEGDTWYCAARARTGDILWPRDGGVARFEAPFNWGPYCVGLAEVQVAEDEVTGVTDLRPLFPDLTHLTTDDVTLSRDLSLCNIDEGQTVQEALERLCLLAHNGCTITVRPDRVSEDVAQRNKALMTLPTLEQALQAIRNMEMPTPDGKEDDTLPRRVSLAFTPGRYVWPLKEISALSQLQSASLKACDAAPVTIYLEDWLAFDTCLNVKLDGITFEGVKDQSGVSAFGGKSIEIDNCQFRRSEREGDPILKLAASRRITLRETRVLVDRSHRSTGLRAAIQLVDTRAQTLFENVFSNGTVVIGPIVPKDAQQLASILVNSAKQNSAASELFDLVDSGHAGGELPHQSGASLRMVGCKLWQVAPDALMIDEITKWAQSDVKANDKFFLAVPDHHARITNLVSDMDMPRHVSATEFVLTEERVGRVDWDSVIKGGFRIEIDPDELPVAMRRAFRTIELSECELKRGTSFLVAQTVSVRNCRLVQFGDEPFTLGLGTQEEILKIEMFRHYIDALYYRLIKGEPAPRNLYPVMMVVAENAGLSGNMGFPREGMPKGRRVPEWPEHQSAPAVLYFSDLNPTLDVNMILTSTVYDNLNSKLVTIPAHFLR